MIVPDTLCNDTLCVDSLEVASQDTLLEELITFDDCSYFAGDTLVHTEVPYRPFGFSASATPFSLRQNGWSGLVLFLCLLLAASLIQRLRKGFRGLLRAVFFPIPGKTDEPIVDDPLRYSTRFIAVCLLSLAAAVVTFIFTQHDVGYYSFEETPYILLGAFFLLWLAYFMAKRLMNNFVNWIFFRSEKIFTWQRSYTFIYVAEAILFLALALVVTYLPFSPEEVLLMAFCLVVFVKILLLFKTYQIFFPKFYGCLHLIVYFCSLELMPLLVLQQLLAYAAWLSVVKL